MPASLSKPPEGPRAAIRVLAGAEVALIIGLVLVIIWVVKPLGQSDLDLTLRVVVGALLLASPRLHHDSRERLGLRLDTFWKALVDILPVTSIAAGLAAAAGYFLVSIDPPANVARELAYYSAWATGQQFALQSVILRRVEDIGLRGRAPLAAAALFSLVHAPSPGLLILTFLGGLLWCSGFRKHPNLLAVSLSHAILAVVIASTLPPAVTGGYRIGSPYLQR